MMRKKRKFCSVLWLLTTAMVMFSSVVASAATVSGGTAYDKLYNETLAKYEADPMFQTHYAENPEGALAMIDTIVSNALKPAPRVTSGYDAWVNNVPLITQSLTNNCGSASTLQTLYGLGKQNAISGSTDTAKQTTLNGSSYLNLGNDGIMVYRIADLLNSAAIKVGIGYAYVDGSTLSATQIQNLIWDSLAKNKPVILHARTQYLNYYNGHQSGHYIVVYGLDKYNGRVALADCNYNSAFGGFRTASINEVKAALPAGRYLIYGL